MTKPQRTPDGAVSADGLNEAQREAVFHQNGPILVIAGAGTGKTRVITERIAHLVNSGFCRHDQVLALTFTEKATAEIEDRVDRLMPLGYQAIPIRTFHGFCGDLLREFGMDIGISPAFKILQGVAHWLFLKEHLFIFELDYYRPLGNPTAFIDALLGAFSRFKEELRSPEAVRKVAEARLQSADTEEKKIEGARLLELASAYGRYQELLTENNFLDFADLQYKTIELFERRPNILAHLQERYRYLLVDEYQDTNIAQNKIVDHLAARHRNLMVVGDDDQSIYKFRGAAISNILQFQEHYPDAKKVVLTRNYRSSQRLLDFAYASISHNNPDRLELKAGVDKKLIGVRPGDDASICLVHASTLDQETEYVIDHIRQTAERGIPLSEIAVLARANAPLQPFTDALKKAGIPYDFVSEKGLYQKEAILDMIAFLRTIANPADDLSFYRLLRMELWKIPMEVIALLIAQSKKDFQTVWALAKKEEAADFLIKTLSDCLDFSKNHTAGETLYRFTESVRLYEFYLKQGTLEAEVTIASIAAFFNKIRDFERGNPQNSVIDFVAYLDLCQEAGENPAARFELSDKEGVFVSTVHGAKGLEFDTVFLTNLTADRFPARDRKDPISIPDELVHEILSDGDMHLAEERRLFYVACTRAKESLHLLYSDFYHPSAAKNPRKKKRSPFIDEVLGTVALTQTEKTIEGVESFLRPRESAVFEIDPERMPIVQFSYSQLMTFSACPRQYQYRYLFKIPEPPNANFSFGGTMHSTLQEFYKNVQQVKQASLFSEFEPDMSLDRLLAIYKDKWIDRGYESKAHMELRRERGREILEAFYDVFKSGVPHIRFLEKAFKLKVGPYTISGRLDRADDLPDGTLEIIDYKSGKSKEEAEVKKDLQLFIYALAATECFGLSASRLTLYFLDDNRAVTIAPDAKKMEKVKAEIIQLGDAVNRSDFAPTPEKFTCDHCPYNRICDAAVF